MLQAPVFDGLSLDPFSLQQDGLAAPEVDVGGIRSQEIRSKSKPAKMKLRTVTYPRMDGG